MGDLRGLHADPGALLQHLLRFDTTNPPGRERPCIEWAAGLLDAYGIDSRLFALDPERPNLVARVGGGSEPPLLLYGHVDVVTTAGQPWSRDPFGGERSDGVIWGRGSLDMKGGDAMMIAAFLRAAHEGDDLPGDVILCLLSDEEAGAEHGARFMVEQHPEQFDGVRFALGEFGGYRERVLGSPSIRSRSRRRRWSGSPAVCAVPAATGPWSIAAASWPGWAGCSRPSTATASR